MKTTMSVLFVLLSLGVLGCSSMYTLHVDKNSDKAFIVSSKGANMKVGDIFVLYKATVVQGSGAGHDHGGSSQHLEKYIVGKVQVVSVVNNEHAAVKLLSGTYESGVTVEKVE